MSSKDKLNKTCERFDHKWRFLPGRQFHATPLLPVRHPPLRGGSGLRIRGRRASWIFQGSKEKKQQLVDDARSKARKDHKSKDNVQAAVEAATKKVNEQAAHRGEVPGAGAHVERDLPGARSDDRQSGMLSLLGFGIKLNVVEVL